MNTTPIIIEEGRVTIRHTAGAVWLTQHQIADLFGVFISAVGANVRSIFKSEVLREEEASRYVSTATGGMTLYNLEMITALAFRLKSAKAEQFREWIMERAVSNPNIIWALPGMEALLN